MQIERKYNVQLHGALAVEYGEQEFTLWACNMQEVMRGLISVYGRKFQNSILHGAWHVVTDKSKDISDEAKSLTENMLDFPIKDEYIHIIPAVQGAGGNGGGVFSIILGVVLIAASVVLGPESAALGIKGISTGVVEASVASSLAIAGAMSMIGGIMSLIVPVPKMNYGVAQRQSFLYNGAVNNTNQGVPVPIVYGEVMTDSTVISADIQTTNVNWNMLTAQQVIDGVVH